jgi:hypothetical protein
MTAGLRDALIMTVAEGEAAMAIDTLESVRAFYPSADFWLLDDHSTDGTAERVGVWAQDHGASFARNEVRRGYYGNAHSIFRLMRQVATSGRVYRWVLKLDPDTRLVQPGLAQLLAARFGAEGPGIVGSCWHAPDGRRRRTLKKHWLALLDMMPVGLHRDRRRLRVGWPFFAPWVLRGLIRGHLPGWHSLGALYAINGSLVQDLEGQGYWSAIPDDFRAILHSEDLLVSLGVAAVGGRLIDINPSGQTPTWLQYRPPLPVSAEQIVERGILVVHPVKGTPIGDAMRERLWELVGKPGPRV